MSEDTQEELFRSFLDANGVASTLESLRLALMSKFYELDSQKDDQARDYHKVALKVEKVGLCFNYL